MRYLLDTNTVIAWTAARNPRVMMRLKEHRNAVILSTIVIHELAFGAFKSNKVLSNLANIDELTFERIDFDSNDARASAEIRADLGRRGKPIGFFDMLLAGQARARNLIVVTNNLGEFGRVDGLKLEDWTA